MSQAPNPPPTRPSKPSSVLPYKTPGLRDHYRIGKKLGQGQFGTTYLCVDKSDGKEYACKSIPKRKLLCREDYEDVWREIQIMHHLSEHPNVVRIKGTYEDALFVHLVMELCAGGELFDRIIQKGHYSERKAAQLIKTIVGVVEACHSLGVMHRDLKPENFLFASAGEDAVLKATDFGLSVFYKPDFESEPWPGISDSAKDLIRNMLNRDPRKRFTAHQLKKMALRVIAESLSEEEIGGLKELFNMIDTDRSGTITFDELKDGLKRVGSEMMESEIQALMDAVCINHD
ncbi:hypothetical protein B296_00021800 [Ensete ventricosum]|uniref:non-specific serine/threonine protein kinase n=1 Tax=Ensete ventricosum TaxID=4639 RepID=A0A426ZUS7_ENSVE|nr:hypothetical protein B296_00021800 [Ensete ventricosum]